VTFIQPPPVVVHQLLAAAEEFQMPTVVQRRIMGDELTAPAGKALLDHIPPAAWLETLAPSHKQVLREVQQEWKPLVSGL
jgi:hypothetical protein